MGISWPNKDPNEVLDYTIDWDGRLGGDTIASSAWTVPAGITKDSDTMADATTTIWLSGGTHNTKYTLENRITTEGGRTLDQSVKILIRNR